VRNAILLALSLIAAPLAAQSAAASGATTLAAAHDLMVATCEPGRMHALMPSMATATGEQFRQMFADRQVLDGLQQQMTAAIQANLASMDDTLTSPMVDHMALVYARHYSSGEPKRLAALMRDPAMTRFRIESPKLMRKIMPVLFAAMQPQQEASQTNIEADRRRLEQATPRKQVEARPPGRQLG
jgi:Uncharacterized protein conserved in bacteria (DUF2059)